MTSNTALWDSVERTPTEHTKAITGKSYSGNSPKPHYLVRKATETFGPCGIGWGFSVVDERVENGPGDERMHIARVRVWYEWNGKRGEVEHIGGTPFAGIRSSGKPFMDEDAPKKSVTDALVKALSMLGFAGDIFMGRYDDSKYVAELNREAREKKQADAQPPSIEIAVPERPGAIPVPASDDMTQVWVQWVKALCAQLARCDDVSDVNAWIDANTAPMERLKAFNAKTHGYVQAQIQNRRGALSQRSAA